MQDFLVKILQMAIFRTDSWLFLRFLAVVSFYTLEVLLLY